LPKIKGPFVTVGGEIKSPAVLGSYCPKARSQGKRPGAREGYPAGHIFSYDRGSKSRLKRTGEGGRSEGEKSRGALTFLIEDLHQWVSKEKGRRGMGGDEEPRPKLLRFSGFSP